MARLRLFANLREIAGVTEAEMPGGTVGEVLDGATARYGAAFGAALASARVWVDGEPADGDTQVGDSSEVALIPPVSGGTTVVRSPVGLELGLVALLAGALFVGNAVSLDWLAVVVVFAGSMWAVDLAAAAQRRGLGSSPAPALAGVLGGALATYRWGIPGMAVATTGAALAALIWSVLQPSMRPIEAVAGSVSSALVATFGVSSIVLLRLRSEDEALVFLFIAVVAVIIAWVGGESDWAVVDPVVALIVGAVGAGVLAGVIWEPDLLNVVAGSVGVAIALVAGRNLGTLVRAGGFFIKEQIPGSLHQFDGIMMAAGPFWLLLTVLD